MCTITVWFHRAQREWTENSDRCRPRASPSRMDWQSPQAGPSDPGLEGARSICVAESRRGVCRMVVNLESAGGCGEGPFPRPESRNRPEENFYRPPWSAPDQMPLTKDGGSDRQQHPAPMNTSGEPAQGATNLRLEAAREDVVGHPLSPSALDSLPAPKSSAPLINIRFGGFWSKPSVS